MNVNEKRKALSEVAKAYLARGRFIQYDQRCMDRRLFLTPRRIKLYPPEAATDKNTVFLDCSSYVGALYYEAFGVELPADLTWHMIDYVEPNVYYYELTHNETHEETEKIKSDIRAVLEPGDVITYDRGVGSGHTMVYIGDDKFTHCTSGKGNPDSYDYENKKSREYDNGGLWIDELDVLLEGRLFHPKTRRFAIARPILEVGDITERTAARLGEAKDLVCYATASRSGGACAGLGETLEYRVEVKNAGEGERCVKISFSPPLGTTLVGDSTAEFDFAEKETKTAVFYARVDSYASPVLCGGSIFVNGLSVFMPIVKVGEALSDSERETVCDKKKYADGECALSSAKEAYSEIGIGILPSEKKIIQSLFYLHDSTSGDVLCRKNQIPECDGAVYSMFGGTCVSTPEMIRIPHIRCTKVMRRDLAAGDIIVVSDDVCANETCSLFYTGEALLGKTERTSPYTELVGKDIDLFVDSLLGRAVFVILRPSMKKGASAR